MPTERKNNKDRRKVNTYTEEESTEWTHQFPIEMRKRFWEYGLNPITGMPPVIGKVEDREAAVGTEVSFGSAKVNGATVF